MFHWMNARMTHCHSAIQCINSCLTIHDLVTQTVIIQSPFHLFISIAFEQNSWRVAVISLLTAIYFSRYRNRVTDVGLGRLSLEIHDSELPVVEQYVHPNPLFFRSSSHNRYRVQCNTDVKIVTSRRNHSISIYKISRLFIYQLSRG